jgi:hypothetical protein
MAGYYRACPGSLDELPLQMIGRCLAPEAQREVAKVMRARLEKVTDPVRLRLYAGIWGIEFRTTPIPEHPVLRKQVAADVRRLETLNTPRDAAWLDFLKSGLKQAGASEESLKAMDERILREFPSSSEAQRIVVEQWRVDHPWCAKGCAPHRKWQWEQFGFESSDTNWESTVLAKIESVKAAK